MRFAAIQHDITWEDKPANHRTVERMLVEANVPAGAFVVLPELGDTGFSFNLDRIVDDQSLAWGRQAARRFGICLQVGHAQRGPDGRGRNAATVITPDGAILATYHKVHPFSYSREIDFYAGGDHIDLIDVGGVTICPMICYDLRFPELWRLAAREGAEVFTIGASWPTGRQQHWRALLIARAIENQAYVVAVNRVGSDPNLTYTGGSIIVSPKGEVLTEGGAEASVLTAELDLAALRAWRRDFPALQDIRQGALGSFQVRRSAARMATTMG